MKESIYFIAILLPDPPANEVRKVQESIAQQFGSSAALRTPVHITLKSPFRVPSGIREDLVQWFHNLRLQTRSFTQELNGFGHFPKATSPVIFIQVVHNEEIVHLEEEVVGAFVEKFPHMDIPEFQYSYHPHVTVAFRDLAPDKYIEAWDEFSHEKFAATFPVGSIHLLEHDGKQWKEIAACVLRS